MARKTTRLVQPVSTMTAYFPTIDTFVALRRGEAWRADDPIVKERPDLFENADDQDAPVEEATAVPGDKRSTRRKPAT
jgi:hypothetical protein